MGREVVGCGGPADEGLYEIRGVAAGRKCGAGYGGGVGEGPGGLLRGLDEEGGASEQGGNYGGEDIVDLWGVSNVDYEQERIGITG